MYKYYFDGVGDMFFAVMFVAVLGAFGALIGYFIDKINNKTRKQVAVTIDNSVQINNEKNEVYYYGFGGWLYIFAAGLVYQFLFNLKIAYDNYLITKTDNYYSYTTIGSESYNSLWETAIWFEIIAASIIVVLVALIAYFCIKQSKKFRTMAILFISVSLFFQCIDLFLMLSIQNGYSEDIFGPSKYDNLYKSTVYAIVWIPYLLLSKRVKNTFIK